MTPPAPASPPSLALKILVGVAVLGVLYGGRGVLEPIMLAVMLAFVMAPIVRQIRRLGLGRATAALATLALVGLMVTAVALMLFAQLGAMSRELPRYEVHAREKISSLRELTVGRLQEMQGRAGRLFGDLAPTQASDTESEPGIDGADTTPRNPAARAGHSSEDSAVLLGQFLGMVWGPLGAVGVVVLVLVFALLEQESLRDRLIRLTGGRDVRAATSALNDAGQRLSRYFISQFSVNISVGLVIWALLSVLGVPHAAVWAVLAGLLRFIPYVGFPAAALCACAMAAVMAPGWELVLSTALVFVGVEVVAAYAVEPLLYGHTTGLSPFSVVVAAIFWGALWGPVGLLLSTPLTLCLVVAGRHVPALAFLEILFGDAPALDLSQRFYQRSLSGDTIEILSDARVFLKRRSLAAYCDKVVMPAFGLGREDFGRGMISPEQQLAAQHVISRVFAELMHAPRSARPRAAVLDGSDLGLRLRQERQKTEGQWQGPLDVPAGSVLLCVSMAGAEARLTAELLVRVLRSERLDARHVTVAELADPPPDARSESVGTVFVVGATADQVVAEEGTVLNECLAHVPQASLVLMLPMLQAGQAPVDQIAAGRIHHTAYSFEEAMALVRQGQRG